MSVHEYTLNELLEHLGLHYSTISVIAKRVEEERLGQELGTASKARAWQTTGFEEGLGTPVLGSPASVFRTGSPELAGRATLELPLC